MADSIVEQVEGGAWKRVGDRDKGRGRQSRVGKRCADSELRTVLVGRHGFSCDELSTQTYVW